MTDSATADAPGSSPGQAPAQAGAAAAPPVIPAEAGTPAPWWQGERFQPFQEFFATKGLAVDDPTEALAKSVKGWQAAEKHLGKPADSLITRPREGQPIAEWMRENAAVFGVPEAPDKYELKKPEMPKGVEWDKALEEQARAVAHEHAVPPAALQALTEVFAGRMGQVFQDAEAALAADNDRMMADLRKDWGETAPQRVELAKQAAQAVGTKAGLSPEGIASVCMAMKDGVGDAGIMRLFATIGEMMGEDSLQGVGNTPLGMTPQQAAAALAAMDARDGEYGRAYAAQDKAEMARLEPKRQHLMRLAAPTVRY
jgi:hypothetical protein